MLILDKLRQMRHRHSEIREFCIQTVRFKKFLENANGLMDLFEDGNEKMRGEYILDRHYVVTLIGSVMEKLGMIVYDACALSPESFEDLYHQYDKHKRISEQLISGEIAFNHQHSVLNQETGSWSEEFPEYLLLTDALFWFNGEAQETVMDVMKNAMTSAILGLERTDALKKEIEIKKKDFGESESRIHLLNLWKTEIQPFTKDKLADGTESLPLKYLFMNIPENCPALTEKTGDWIVAASEYEVTLMSMNPDFNLRMEATASGYKESDYIFLYMDHRLQPEKILPKGFHLEKTEAGSLCWKVDESLETIEDSLMAIGEYLFS